MYFAGKLVYLIVRPSNQLAVTDNTNPHTEGTATPMAHIDPVFSLRFGEYGASSV